MILAASIAVVGIFAVAKQFLGWPKGGFKDNLWLLVAGVAAFTLYLLIDEYRKFKRQAGVRELVKKLSFTFSAEGSEEIAERLGKLLAGRLGKLIGTSDRDFELENVIQGARDGVQILVGDLETTIHGSEDDTVITQTIVYFTGPDLCLPKFALQPEGSKRSLAGRLAGKTDSDSEGLPAFSDSYHLSSSEAGVTERLFGLELQEHLATHQGWEIRAEHESILLAQSGQVPVAEWESLLDESLQFLSLLNQSVDQLIKSPPSPDPPRSSSRVAVKPERLYPAGSGGFTRLLFSFFESAVASAESQAVHWDEVDHFLKLPTPRTIPERIYKQSIRSVAPTSLILLIICVPVGLIGALIIGLSAFFFRNNLFAGSVSGLVGMIHLTVAAAGINKAFDYRRRDRLLREGVLAKATIRNIRSHTWFRDACRADIFYSADDKGLSRTITLRGPHVELARKHAESGEETPILYDRRTPKRFLLGLQLTSQHIGT